MHAGFPVAPQAPEHAEPTAMHAAFCMVHVNGDGQPRQHPGHLNEHAPHLEVHRGNMEAKIATEINKPNLVCEVDIFKSCKNVIGSNDTQLFCCV